MYKFQEIRGSCFRDFEKVSKAITADHGKPYLTSHHELPGRNEADVLGLIIEENAIRSGQTSWYSQWKSKDTLIILLLKGETEEMTFEIGFKGIDVSNQK